MGLWRSTARRRGARLIAAAGKSPLHLVSAPSPNTSSIRGGDYVLALKGNQGAPRQADASLFLDDPERAAAPSHTTVEAGHGRIETRAAQLSTDIEWLQEQHQWPGLAASGKLTRTREIALKPSAETRLLSAQRAAIRRALRASPRGYWGIENGLHWALDVTMNEGSGEKPPRQRPGKPRAAASPRLQPGQARTLQGIDERQAQTRRLGGYFPRHPTGAVRQSSNAIAMDTTTSPRVAPHHAAFPARRTVCAM